MKLQTRIDKYLLKALEDKSEMGEEAIERFGERCKDALRKQFNGKKHDYTLRMSTIGKPLCQQQMDKSGAKGEPLPPSLKMKFTYGDMVEALMMAILEDSGAKIESYQEEVRYDLGAANIKGTLDVIIDGKVYDIKSASKTAFKKFSHPYGFTRIVSDDPFGYVSQGYLYSAAKGLPFGGWIVFNKETGDIAICEAPKVGSSYEKVAIETARKNAKSLVNDEPFERCFEKEVEKVRKRPTSNYVLPLTCRYCKFKSTCWGDELGFHKNPRGETFKWYVGKPV